MRFLVNGDTELRRPDAYEIAISPPGGTGDTVFLFRTERDFQQWMAANDQKAGKHITSLMDALQRLTSASRTNQNKIERDVRARAAIPNPVVGLTLYEHINYAGRSLGEPTLVAYPDLTWSWLNFNDLASSFKVTVPVAALFEHTWFKGRSWWIWGPQDNPWVGNWWNDRISSCVCGPSWEEIIAVILALLS
jgi:hypothetical protein